MLFRSDTEVRLMSNLVRYLNPGDLIEGVGPAGRAEQRVFQVYWPLAAAESFAPCRAPGV